MTVRETMIQSSRPYLGQRIHNQQDRALAALIGVMRWRWRAILTTAAAFVAAALIYLAFAESKFTATAQIMADTKRSIAEPTQQSSEGLVDAAVVDSQIETIRSDKVALEVIGRLNLGHDLEFVNTEPGFVDIALSRIGLGSDDKPLSEETRRQIALARLRSALEVTRLGRSYVAEIAFTSNDADKAASVANAIAAAYIASQQDANVAIARRAADWMEQRIATLGDQANQANQAVEEFKSANNIMVDRDGKLASEAELSQLSSALATARADTVQSEAKLNRMKSIMGGGAASGGAEALSSSYGTELEIARAREQALDNRITEVFQQNSASRGGLVQLRALEAKAAAYRAVYDTFLNQHARAIQQQTFPTSEARILGDASPPLGTSAPRSKIILLLAAFLGGTIGFAGAYAAEYTRRPVRSAAQIEQELGLRGLTSIPEPKPIIADVAPAITAVSKGRAAGSAATAGEMSIRLAGDDLRPVLLAIEQRRRNASCMVVAIVSPSDNEGKSTLAYNLARLAAESGRTLLIDGDYRDRDLTRALTPRLDGDGAHGGNGPAAGASAAHTNGAASGVKAEAKMQGANANGAGAMQAATPAISLRPRGPCFDFLKAGELPPEIHPSRVLGSLPIAERIAAARTEYTTIIIDTPSILGHIDLLASVHLMDLFVIVARWGQTTIDDLDRTLAMSDVIAARSVGVVVNKAPR